MLTLRFDSEDSARLSLPHRRLLAGKWIRRLRESYLHLHQVSQPHGPLVTRVYR